MVSIDEDLHRRAKEKLFNISFIVDRALREALLIEESDERGEITKCDFCDREMRKATADELDGLNWLCPDEKWICPSCLETKKRQVPAAR